MTVEVVSFPVKNGDSLYSYDSLPDGNQQYEDLAGFHDSISIIIHFSELF